MQCLCTVCTVIIRLMQQKMAFLQKWPYLKRAKVQDLDFGIFGHPQVCEFQKYKWHFGASIFATFGSLAHREHPHGKEPYITLDSRARDISLSQQMSIIIIQFQNFRNPSCVDHIMLRCQTLVSIKATKRVELAILRSRKALQSTQHCNFFALQAFGIRSMFEAS